MTAAPPRNMLDADFWDAVDRAHNKSVLPVGRPAGVVFTVTEYADHYGLTRPGAATRLDSLVAAGDFRVEKRLYNSKVTNFYHPVERTT